MAETFDDIAVLTEYMAIVARFLTVPSGNLCDMLELSGAGSNNFPRLGVVSEIP